ncbi:MAG: ugpC, partial [Proteobacteria bacterium]|nr:ugpC [Pseudomonadota bacterium]
KAGEIQQVGKPEEVYHRPVNLFVADFLGNPGMNFMKGHLRLDGGRISADVGAAMLPLDGYAFETVPTDGQAVVVGLRPESIQPAAAQTSGGGVPFSLTLKPILTEHTGSDNLVVLVMGEQEIVAKFPSDMLPKLGEPVAVGFDLSRLSVFDAGTERRI